MCRLSRRYLHRLRQATLLCSRKMQLIFFLSGLLEVTRYLLTFFEDLIDHFAAELVHMLVLELLDAVASHDLSTNLLLFFAHHHGLLCCSFWESLSSNILVSIDLVFHGKFDCSALLKSELAQRAHRPSVLHRDVLECVVGGHLLHRHLIILMVMGPAALARVFALTRVETAPHVNCGRQARRSPLELVGALPTDHTGLAGT